MARASRQGLAAGGSLRVRISLHRVMLALPHLIDPGRHCGARVVGLCHGRQNARRAKRDCSDKRACGFHPNTHISEEKLTEARLFAVLNPV